MIFLSVKMKIRVKTDSPLDSPGLQIWDIFYAYIQFINRKNGYKSDLDIKIGNDIDPESGSINVAWYHSPETIKTVKEFDLVLLDKGQHHLEVCTQAMFDLLSRHNNCYFICSSYVGVDHPWQNKIIWTPMMMNVMRYYTVPFYPTFFEKTLSTNHKRKKNMIFINGQNRTHRQYFMTLLTNAVPDIDIFQSEISSNVPDKLKDCFFETKEDRKFREVVNLLDHYELSDNAGDVYIDSSIPIGIENKFGLASPGFFIMDLYYDYNCVIFPDTSWINDHIWPTEKISKCILAGSIPWPIAGSSTHNLYNELGYLTAWNLLPDDLQSFDQDQDHQNRYKNQVKAIKWAYQHPEIWTNDKAHTIRDLNLKNYFINDHDSRGSARMYKILSEKFNIKQKGTS